MKNITQQLATRLNLFLLLSFFVAFYVGFRMPNLWSINYYIPSFFEGFHRRSLLGSILFPFGDLRFNYYFIVALQIVVFALLTAVVIKKLLHADPKVKTLFVLYLLAPTGGYLFHEIGYVDQLLYLMLLYMLYSRNQIVNNTLLVASLFIHEMSLFTIIPLYLAKQIYDRAPTRQWLTSLILCLLAFMSIYLFFQTADKTTVSGFLQKLSAAANYSARADYYQIFDNSFTGERNRIYYGKAFTLDLLLAGSLGLVIARLFTLDTQDLKHKALLFAAVFAACTGPLFLGLFGWDASRWVFLSFSSSMLMLYMLGPRIPLPQFASLSFILALFLGYGLLGYFDDYAPRDLHIESIWSFWRHELLDLITTIPSDKEVIH